MPSTILSIALASGITLAAAHADHVHTTYPSASSTTLTPSCVPTHSLCTASSACCGTDLCTPAPWDVVVPYQCLPSPPACYDAGTRCAGAPDYPYIPYASCCSGEACVEDAERGWGRWCVEGSAQAPEAEIEGSVTEAFVTEAAVADADNTVATEAVEDVTVASEAVEDETVATEAVATETAGTETAEDGAVRDEAGGEEAVEYESVATQAASTEAVATEIVATDAYGTGVIDIAATATVVVYYDEPAASAEPAATD